MNRLFCGTQHQHVFKVTGYAPADNVNQVKAALSRSTTVPFAAFKTLNGLLNELRSGERKLLPFSHMEKAIRADGYDPDLMLALHSEFMKFVDYGYNLVVTTGLNDVLDKYYKGSSYTAAHYCGLTDGTPTVAAGDTMASHAGWVEVTAYDEAVRQTITWGSVSGGSVNNSASKAVFTISTNSTTIGGGFVVTNSTKGGSTGTLVGAAAFTAGDKVLDDNDTLSVTVTATATAA